MRTRNGYSTYGCRIEGAIHEESACHICACAHNGSDGTGELTRELTVTRRSYRQRGHGPSDQRAESASTAAGPATWTARPDWPDTRLGTGWRHGRQGDQRPG